MTYKEMKETVRLASEGDLSLALAKVKVKQY
jgi:hypothetical protein